MAEHLAQEFRRVFQHRDSDALKARLISGAASEIPGLKLFVAGIERDWSNGQVERQVHRLEILKRQMYGRGFLLLHRRILLFLAPSVNHHKRSRFV